MRVLAGFETSLFNVAGQTMIADIFDPVNRGTAVGFFMAGTTVSPALGPLLGGIMVTFSTWRSIFWLQAIMAAFGLILSILFIPSTLSPPLKSRDSTPSIASLKLFNPLPTLSLVMYPNILLTNLTCGFLGWVQYSLLASPRNLPIFTGIAAPSSLTPSLFYLAPGAGFLVGTLFWGKFSDNAVRRYTASRGFRLPQDRLNASVAGFFIATVAFLIYGWALQKSVGGIPLAVVSIFVTGFGLMASFNCLNTYSAGKTSCLSSACYLCWFLSSSSATISSHGGKYLVQYAFAAAGSASIVPLIESVGIGSACTISVALVLVGSGCTMIVAQRGQEMQEWWMEKNSQ
ncbi:major facilitator superfamily domain-containing protein [Bisporella sp. PMI_857]|nr:major facilitator superfamily domain-containing protein [Bisporella sp. PMI_857]